MGEGKKGALRRDELGFEAKVLSQAGAKALWAEAMAWAKAWRREDGPGRELQVLPRKVPMWFIKISCVPLLHSSKGSSPGAWQATPLDPWPSGKLQRRWQ